MMKRRSWQGGGCLAVGTVAIIMFCLGAMADRQAFFACWLSAWWTCAGIVLGSQASLWLHDLTGGAWGLPLRPVWRRATATMPMLLALMLPLVAATWMFYPWSDPSWAPASQHPAFQAFWLSPTFVTMRLVVYAALWLSLSLDAGKRHKGMSVLGLIVYALTISLAGVDLVLSLMPQWYSSGFGLIAITMQMKLGFAVGIVGATVPGLWRSRRHNNKEASTEPASTFSAELGRDWGNLLLMYVMMWAYIAFVQFLIIWAENLPNEIAWYVPRLQTGWIWLGVLLVVAGFFAPLLLLLLRAIKQDRLRLRAVAIALCVLGWLESIWVTLPSIPGLTWHALWMTPLALAGMIAMLLSMAMPGERTQSVPNRAAAVPQQGNES